MLTVNLGGRSLFFNDQGSGSPVVLLSGLGGDHRAFAVTARELAKRYRVLTLDHRDVGRSSRVDSDYTTSDMAEDVASWLTHLDVESAHVVGHSLGGLVAQELALGFPEKVKSLVLASTHAGANDWRKAVIEAWVMARQQNGPGDFTRMTLPWLVAPGFYHNPAQVTGMIRFAETNEFAQDSAAFTRQAKAALRHDTRSRLSGLRLPTLVLVGDSDLVNPPTVSNEMVGLIAGAELAVMPGVGHLPHIEAGADFRQLVGAFLDRCDSLPSIASDRDLR